MTLRRLLAMLAAAAVLVTGALLWAGAAEGKPSTQTAHAKSEKLGPVGYRKLRLGMSRAQVKRTHQATVGKREGTCSVVRLRAHRATGFLSARHGLVAIFAAGPMHTPKGIRLGATRAQVRHAYPHLKDGPNGSYITVRGNRKAQYLFLFQGAGPRARLYELGLAGKNQDCFD